MFRIVIDFCKRILRYAVENGILHYFNKSFETASDVESGFTCYAQCTHTQSLHEMYSSLKYWVIFWCYQTNDVDLLWRQFKCYVPQKGLVLSITWKNIIRNIFCFFMVAKLCGISFFVIRVSIFIWLTIFQNIQELKCL